MCHIRNNDLKLGASFFAGPMVGSVIYTALNSYVTRFTFYWPLTIGIIILLLVLFVPGGILSVIDARIAVYRQSRKATINPPISSKEKREET